MIGLGTGLRTNANGKFVPSGNTPQAKTNGHLVVTGYRQGTGRSSICKFFD